MPTIVEAVCPDPPQDKLARGFFNFPQAVFVNETGCFMADTCNSRIQFLDFIDVFGNSNYLVSPAYVDFGMIPPGTIAEENVYIRNVSGGQITGIVDIPKESPWLKTHVSSFKGDEEPIVFYVDT